jgi:hypothetical protein
VLLGDDDAGLFAVEFLRTGELAAEKFDEAAGPRTSIGAQKAHAEEEYEELEDFGVFDGAQSRALRSVLLGFGEEDGKCVVEFALNERNGRLLVDDASDESFVGVREGAKSGEHVGIGGGGLAGTELRDGESDGGKKTPVDLDGVGVDAHVEKGSVGGEGAGMFVLVAMSGEEVGAVGGAVDGDFALGATTDGADFLGLGGAETARLALLADWTSHDEIPWRCEIGLEPYWLK